MENLTDLSRVSSSRLLRSQAMYSSAASVTLGHLVAMLQNFFIVVTIAKLSGWLLASLQTLD